MVKRESSQETLKVNEVEELLGIIIREMTSRRSPTYLHSVTKLNVKKLLIRTTCGKVYKYPVNQYKVFYVIEK